MIFGKTIKTWKDIKEKKNATKTEIKQRQKELRSIVPFQAKMVRRLNILNMLLSCDDDIDFTTIETDNISESTVAEYINQELKDYVVKKRDNSLLYDFKLKEIQF